MTDGRSWSYPSARAVLILGTALLMAGCMKSQPEGPKELIVGKWQPTDESMEAPEFTNVLGNRESSEGPMIVEFGDSYVMTSAKDTTLQRRYKFVDDETIEVEIDVPPFVPDIGGFRHVSLCAKQGCALRAVRTKLNSNDRVSFSVIAKRVILVVSP